MSVLLRFFEDGSAAVDSTTDGDIVGRTAEENELSAIEEVGGGAEEEVGTGAKGDEIVGGFGVDEMVGGFGVDKVVGGFGMDDGAWTEGGLLSRGGELVEMKTNSDSPVVISMLHSVASRVISGSTCMKNSYINVQQNTLF